MLPALPTAHFYQWVSELFYLSLLNVDASFSSDIYVSFPPLPVLDVLISIVSWNWLLLINYVEDNPLWDVLIVGQLVSSLTIFNGLKQFSSSILFKSDLNIISHISKLFCLLLFYRLNRVYRVTRIAHTPFDPSDSDFLC